MIAADTIHQAYEAFNERDIAAALALMTEDVHWPKASEGGSVVGKEAIRDYWTRQWGQFDPHVEPLAVTAASDGSFHVQVHQRVNSLAGEVLSEGEVFHIFTMRNGLISSMTLGDALHASAAFAHPG